MYILQSPSIVASDTPLVEAIALLAQKQEDYVLVLERTKLQGIFTERDAVRAIASGIDLAQGTIAEVMVREVLTVTQSEAENLLKVWVLFQEHQLQYLPVLDDRGQIVGIITENSLLQNINPQQLDLELQELYDRAPCGYHSLDKEGNFVRINDTELKMLGYAREELIGKKKFVDLLSSESLSIFAENFPIFQECGWVNDLEFHLIRKDGSIFPVSLSATAVKDAEGNFLISRSVVVDISDRKAAEEALKESEERWQLAVRGTNDGIWDWNIKTNEVFFSTRWKEMLGYEDCEIANNLDEWSKRVHPNDLGWVTQVIQDHFDRQTPFYTSEHRLRCKDGTYKWILDRGQAFWDEAGNPVRMAGSHTDITERKLAEEELQRQNQRARLFADISLKIRQSLQPEEILQTSVIEVQKLLKVDRVLIFRFWLDGSGTVVQESVLPGFPVILGEKIYDPCFHEDYQEQYRQGRVSAIVDIEKAQIQECHVNLLKQFSVKANLVVPIIERENCWGLLIAHQCSSPREWSKFEVELLQLLANQIGIALAQAQLLETETQQRQELTRSNADLEQFAYIASHDLQEPLRMVTSYLQLLQKRYRDKLDRDADEFINYAVDGATRMQGLIQDILSYSRVSTRGQPFKQVNGDRLLQDALNNLKVAIAESNATITFDPLPQIVADGIQLTQLFQNLIANAIKFRREIPLKIHIGVEKIDNSWLFSACDNGIGIEQQYFDKIFLIFQRLHRRADYPGTGIGLAICKKIVERHGGKIWLESEPKKGSIFYFTIPETPGNKT